MSDINAHINQLVNDFVNAVTAMARQAAIATLNNALGGSNGGAVVKRGPGRPRKNPLMGSFAGGFSMPALNVSASASRGKRGKRTSVQLDKIVDSLFNFIQMNPGQRVEQINKALGTTTKDLALPIRKMLAEGTIRSEGAKRATAYFVTGGGKRGKRGKA